MPVTEPKPEGEPSTDFDIQKHIAHIEQMLNQSLHERQETLWAPWQAALVGMTAGAVLFAAGMFYAAHFMRP